MNLTLKYKKRFDTEKKLFNEWHRNLYARLFNQRISLYERIQVENQNRFFFRIENILIF
jgi:hypothetical protein